jgi:Flp pilus assembly protein TadB
VRFPLNTTAIAAVAVFAIAGYEYYTGREYRVGPGTVLLIGALLVARYIVQVQARRRTQMLKEVPKRPLGLDD